MTEAPIDRREWRRILLAVALWTPVVLSVGIAGALQGVVRQPVRAMEQITLYSLTVPVKPGDRLSRGMVSEWTMSFPKGIGGPQAVGAGDCVIGTDLKVYLGKPFMRSADAQAELTKDMFEPPAPSGLRPAR